MDDHLNQPLLLMTKLSWVDVILVPPALSILFGLLPNRKSDTNSNILSSIYFTPSNIIIYNHREGNIRAGSTTIDQLGHTRNTVPIVSRVHPSGRVWSGMSYTESGNGEYDMCGNSTWSEDIVSTSVETHCRIRVRCNESY